uniref:Uncharacterized protein n=1 Tax=Magnetococcus massalia (strain MO-1) TaxID=451514 RepID=A0A1S7LKK6_MAGMO|nr:protein of unknown function [Candidatus Magnetococcus massalia]
MLVPYSFLPVIDDVQTGDRLDDHFLGAYISPEELQMYNMITTKDYSMAQSIATTSLDRADFLKSIMDLKGDELFASTLGAMFLQELFLDRDKRSFTLNEKSRDQLIAQNRCFEKKSGGEWRP